MKFEASSVGRPALQRLYGARGMLVQKELLFFTGAGYSKAAAAYAEEVHMAIFKYGLDGKMVPMSSAARRLIGGLDD